MNGLFGKNGGCSEILIILLLLCCCDGKGHDGCGCGGGFDRRGGGCGIDICELVLLLIILGCFCGRDTCCK